MTVKVRYRDVVREVAYDNYGYVTTKDATPSARSSPLRTPLTPLTRVRT